MTEHKPVLPVINHRADMENVNEKLDGEKERQRGKFLQQMS